MVIEKQSGTKMSIRNIDIRCGHSRTSIVLSVVGASLFTVAVWIFIFFLIFRPSYLKFFGFAPKYFLTNPLKNPDSAQSEHLLELISNGTILSLDNLWTMQTGLYQTIITVLIAINAILCALSFVLIRNSTNSVAREEARKETITEVSIHLSSAEFNKRLKKIVKDKIKDADFDIGDIMQSIEYLSNSIEDLQKQNQLLQAQVDIFNKKSPSNKSENKTISDDELGNDLIISEGK